MEGKLDENMVKQLMDGENLGRAIMLEHTNYDELKVAIPYMMAVFIRASEDKKITTDLFVTMANLYEVLLEKSTE